MDDPAGLTPQERAAAVSWDLARGARLTTADIARRLGLSLRGARWLMCRISRVIPIVRDVDGCWSGQAGAGQGDTLSTEEEV